MTYYYWKKMTIFLIVKIGLCQQFIFTQFFVFPGDITCYIKSNQINLFRQNKYTMAGDSLIAFANTATTPL